MKAAVPCASRRLKRSAREKSKQAAVLLLILLLILLQLRHGARARRTAGASNLVVTDLGNLGATKRQAMARTILRASSGSGGGQGAPRAASDATDATRLERLDSNQPT